MQAFQVMARGFATVHVLVFYWLTNERREKSILFLSRTNESEQFPLHIEQIRSTHTHTQCVFPDASLHGYLPGLGNACQFSFFIVLFVQGSVLILQHMYHKIIHLTFIRCKMSVKQIEMNWQREILKRENYFGRLSEKTSSI